MTKTKKRKAAPPAKKPLMTKPLEAVISDSAKTLATAKRNYIIAERLALESLARSIGYSDPVAVASLIMEELETAVTDHTSAAEWEQQFRFYARRQQLQWQQEALDAEQEAATLQRKI